MATRMTAKKQAKKESPAKAGACKVTAKKDTAGHTPPMSNARKSRVLQAHGAVGGAQYIDVLCRAIDAEITLPTDGLKRLRTALGQLLEPGSHRDRLDGFAREIGLNPTRGRPRADEQNFERACEYWSCRLGWEDESGLEPMSHADAVRFVAERSAYRDESIIEKAVKRFPSAENLMRSIHKAAIEGPHRK